MKKISVIIFTLAAILALTCFISGNVYAVNKINSKSTNKAPITLAQVKQPTLSSSGIANWSGVPNAKKYEVQLYLNGSKQGEPVILVNGKTSYNFLSSMRAGGQGSYFIKVTAKGDGKSFADGSQSKPSREQIIRTLSQADQPIWSDNTIYWSMVDNSSSYIVSLFSGDELLSTKTIPSDIFSCDFGDVISQNSPGIFTASIQAKGRGLYLDGEVSSLSGELIRSVPLDQVNKPSLSDLGIATWPNVANAARYKVQLYLNGSALGKPQTVISGDKGHDFLPAMRAAGTGSYSVKVTAIGNGLYTDSPQSEASNVQEISKAESVTIVNLSTQGIVTWTPTNGSSYDLKLYKEGILVNEQKEVLPGYDYVPIMKNFGIGKYSVTVTARSDSGLIIDGDESPASAAQMIASLPKLAIPTWVADTIFWSKDEKASSYEVSLYKGKDIISTQTVPAEITSIDFSNIISMNSPGDFKVTVLAKGPGLSSNNIIPIFSASNVKIIKLPKVEKPVLSTSGIASWKNIPTINSYEVRLYADNKELVDWRKISTGDMGVDFSSSIRGAYTKLNRRISFTVKVVAFGNGQYLDSDESEASDPLITGPIATSNGTAEIIFTPVTTNFSNYDYIHIINITPKDGLIAGIETTFIVDVEFNLVSSDTALLLIYANHGENPNLAMEVTRFKVYKGSGKLRFVTSIKPNKQFWITSSLINENDAKLIFTSQKETLDVK